MRKRILSLLLAALLALSLAAPAAAANATPFTDISEDKWYYTYVKDLYENHVVDGTSPTTFSPTGTITLGQALKLLLLIGGYPEQAPTTTHWASGYYRLANNNDFLGSARSLSLDQPINRLQFAQIAASVLGLSRLNHKGSPFIDTGNVSVLALYDYGFITGSYEDGKLHFFPLSKISRAEMAAIIWRVKDLGLDTESTVPVDTEPTVQPEPEPPTVPDPAPDTAPDTEPDPGFPDTSGNYSGNFFTYSGRTVYLADNVARSPYDNSLFQKDARGFMTYAGSGFTQQVGIDVSRYQGSIDWAAVKEAGIEFAIIRLGYRGYGQAGTLVQDSCFTSNIKGAIAHGIPVGVYFFSQATSRREAVEEANFVLERVKGYRLSLPIVFDWEPYPASKNARTNGLSDRVLTQCAVAFCETVKNAGYQPMVYSNLSYFYLHFDISQFADYPLWLAQYNKKPTFRYNYLIWQYGSTGSVPGIEGDVDMNIMLTPRE